MTPETLAKPNQRWARFWEKLGTALHNTRFCPRISIPEIFPSIEDEFAPYKEFFRGNILNAGAGNRDISQLVVGTLFNQDIPEGLHNANIHIYSPLHAIPKPDGFFDTIICNAVMEHVRNPHEVMHEFARVCKPGGHLYLGIPFMQPEHKDPTDFQRYTQDGICELVNQHGFDVVKVEGVHSVYTSIAWFCHDWLNSRQTVTYFLLKLILLPYLKRNCLASKHQVNSLQSCYRVLARRRNGENKSRGAAAQLRERHLHTSPADIGSSQSPNAADGGAN
jgi:SAM-dependent methyltransferase